MNISRRKFICVSTSGLIGLSSFDNSISECKKETANISLFECFKRVRGKGFSCAETIFLSILKYFDKPEELVCIATGFGGGIKMKDLCGYYTGGVMGIGLYCDREKGDDKETGAKCSKLVKEYTKWWQSHYPLHCRNIKPEGTSGDICKEVGNEAVYYLDALFKRKAE